LKTLRHEIDTKEPDDLDLDRNSASRIIDGMQQQYLLEVCQISTPHVVRCLQVSLADQLIDESSDQDLLITIIACYARSPYTLSTDLQMIVNS
jgi:hypothetical protein